MFFLHNHGRLFQYLSTFSGVFSVITSGINLGWTSPYLPLLLNSSSPIPTTSAEGSWCAVMPLVGAPVGALAAAILSDVIGRKNTILLLAPIVFCCFVALAFAQTITLISIIRFIVGATEGGAYTVLPMYIGEIASPQIRGFLTSTVAIAGIIGTLFINVIGQKLTIYWSSLVCASIPVIHCLTFVWMPESPYYYIKKKKYESAGRSLSVLRGANDVGEEMDELRRVVEKQEANKAKTSDLFLVPSNRRACLIFAIVCVTNKFSGKNPCLFYTTMIFRNAGTSVSPELSAIVYCVVELVAMLVATAVVDWYGRRRLLIISTSGCCLSLSILGTYFYFQQLINGFDWLPLACLTAYNILFSMGLAFGTVTVVSELFPTNIKGRALGFADTFSVTMGTIASKFFQTTNDTFGMYVPFWGFAISCAVGLVLIVRFVPETKGKSLGEIQSLLLGSSKN